MPRAGILVVLAVLFLSEPALIFPGPIVRVLLLCSDVDLSLHLRFAYVYVEHRSVVCLCFLSSLSLLCELTRMSWSMCLGSVRQLQVGVMNATCHVSSFFYEALGTDTLCPQILHGLVDSSMYQYFIRNCS